jgi:hypothetical protein
MYQYCKEEIALMLDMPSDDKAIELLMVFLSERRINHCLSLTKMSKTCKTFFLILFDSPESIHCNMAGDCLWPPLNLLDPI